MTEAPTVVLAPGELWFGADAVVQTLLGSCVAVTLWHPGLRLGGMCHYLLPSRHPGGPVVAAARPGRCPRADGLLPRYADEAVALLLHHVASAGTRPEEYAVSVVGGGRQFGVDGPASTIDVSTRNVEAAERLLPAAGLKVVRRDVGGNGARVVRLDLRDGSVSLRRTGDRVEVPA